MNLRIGRDSRAGSRRTDNETLACSRFVRSLSHPCATRRPAFAVASLLLPRETCRPSRTAPRLQRQPVPMSDPRWASTLRSPHPASLRRVPGWRTVPRLPGAPWRDRGSSLRTVRTDSTGMPRYSRESRQRRRRSAIPRPSDRSGSRRGTFGPLRPGPHWHRALRGGCGSDWS